MRLRHVAGYGALAVTLGVACGGRTVDVGSPGEPVQGEGGAPRGAAGETGAMDDSGSALDASVTVDATSVADASCGNADMSPGDADTTDSASCSIVLASQYDQSCTVDSDCVPVGEVGSCPASACDGCWSAAINHCAAPQYMSALARVFASLPPGSACNCPAEGSPGAICRAGKCQLPSFVADDTLPACADAGGQCALSAGITCNRMGPPDSCAYSDEVCCLPTGSAEPGRYTCYGCTGSWCGWSLAFCTNDAGP